jgi:DNA repair protein RecN (Recombination protein N)
LRVIVETWEDDPERLESVRGRRQVFRQLERKYGGSLAEVLGFATTARQRLDAIGHDEQRALQLDDEIRSAGQALESAESNVASARRRAAPRLAGEIEATIRGLAMPSARFSISVEGGGPADQVTFWLAANPGEPSQPLAKVASGGELARTMMAVRLAVGGSPGVMAFDEVDAGVGGAAATAVGMALAGLGRGAQVLVVTHLAQVAALADHQIEVRKFEQGGRTCSDVVSLDTEGRVIEISRMLSGRRSVRRGPSLSGGRSSGRAGGAAGHPGVRTAARLRPLASTGARHGWPPGSFRGGAAGRSTLGIRS